MINKIKKIVGQLSEQEAKSHLLLHFLRIEMLEERNYPEAEFLKDIRKEYRNLLKDALEPKQQPYHTAHIVFGDSSAGSLKITLSKDEKVIALSDQFSIGPVHLLHTERGIQQRKKWLIQHINLDEQYLDSYLEDFQQTLMEIKNIPEHIPIFIWTANNAHEQTAARFIIHALKGKKNDLRLINIHTSYQIHHPLHTGEVEHEKLKRIYAANKKIQPLSEKILNKLAEEWTKLSKTTEVLRIWEDKHIKSVSENYFDACIIDRARYLHNMQTKADFMKSARLIGVVLGHIDQYTGDQFIEYRVRQLILKGKFDIEGVPKAMRFYSVKLNEQ